MESKLKKNKKVWNICEINIYTNRNTTAAPLLEVTKNRFASKLLFAINARWKINNCLILCQCYRRNLTIARHDHGVLNFTFTVWRIEWRYMPFLFLANHHCFVFLILIFMPTCLSSSSTLSVNICRLFSFCALINVSFPCSVRTTAACSQYSLAIIRTPLPSNPANLSFSISFSWLT